MYLCIYLAFKTLFLLWNYNHNSLSWTALVTCRCNCLQVCRYEAQSALHAPLKESKQRLSWTQSVWAPIRVKGNDFRGLQRTVKTPVTEILLPHSLSAELLVKIQTFQRLTCEQRGITRNPKQSISRRVECQEQVIASIIQSFLNICLNNWKPLSPIWMVECCGSTTPMERWGQYG